jgi:DNA-binding MarR family transcriptional regulator
MCTFRARPVEDLLDFMVAYYSSDQKGKTISRTRVSSVINNLRALSAELDHLDEAASELYGLNRTDMRALDIVGREGPIAPTALAHAMGFTTGGVTTVIDRLEQAGYVRRRPDATDRRRLTIEVTEGTRDHDRAVFGPLQQATARLLQGYDDDRLSVVEAFLVTMRELTAKYAASLGEPGAPR